MLSHAFVSSILQPVECVSTEWRTLLRRWLRSLSCCGFESRVVHLFSPILPNRPFFTFIQFVPFFYFWSCRNALRYSPFRGLAPNRCLQIYLSLFLAFVLFYVSPWIGGTCDWVFYEVLAFFGRKWNLLFSKDTINLSKVTAKTFIMF